MIGIGRLLMAGSGALALSACTTIGEGVKARHGYYTQNVPDISAENVALFVERQDRIWDCFVQLARAHPSAPAAALRPAGGPGPTSCSTGPNGGSADDAISKGEFISVVHAGLHYVDVRCDRYMVALTDLERIRRAGSDELEFGASTSSAVLTLLKASEQLIGLVPLGFGFLNQTWNNVGRGLLYDLPPDAVRILVEKQQNAYLEGLASSYTSKPQALRAIQGYAALCLAPSIEAEVKRSIGNAEYEPIDWEKRLGRSPPAAAGAPATNNQNVANAGDPPGGKPAVKANQVPGVQLKEPK